MAENPPTPEELPSPRARVVICPFCGGQTEEAASCSLCSARFDPLSRQATQNTMGPWWVHDKNRPFSPGCRFQAMVRFVETGRVSPDSVVRGPSTRQFWMLAKHTPGIANLFGVCHNCAQETEPDAYSCDGCGALFSADADRQHLGLGPVRELGSPSTVAPQASVAAGSVGSSPTVIAPMPVARPHRPGTPIESPTRVRSISGRRVAVNWVVGTAVFMIVMGMVLTALEVAPADLFNPATDEPSLAQGDQASLLSTPGVPNKPVTGPEDSNPGPQGFDETPQSLRSPAEVQTDFVAPDGLEDVKNVAPAESEGVTRTEQIRLAAIDALRLGDPAALRAALTETDAVLTLPRAPEWASPIRARLLKRLARGQFARLP